MQIAFTLCVHIHIYVVVCVRREMLHYFIFRFVSRSLVLHGRFDPFVNGS